MSQQDFADTKTFSQVKNRVVRECPGSEQVDDYKAEEAAPIIIRSNPLQQRVLHKPHARLLKNGGLSTQKRTAAQINKLSLNNSIIIDCNVLIGEKEGKRTGSCSRHDANQTLSNFNQSVLTQMASKESVDRAQHHPSRQTNQKICLLGNPLRTS